MYDLLLEAELITEGAEPNRSGEYLVECFSCGRKKLYANSESGAWTCQHCQIKGNLESLKLSLEPLDAEQELFRSILFYAKQCLQDVEENDLGYHHFLDRGFTKEDIKKYQFGYLYKGWASEFNRDDLEEYGFLSNGRPIFYNHAIIPFIKNGKIQTLKGRCLEATKSKYKSVIGIEVPLYFPAEPLRSVRTFLAEGELKSCRLQSEGYQSIGVAGAGNAKKHIPYLNSFPDLYICFDSDLPNTQFNLGCGQQSAINLAQKLEKCHVITLPLQKEKIGVDDYLQEYGKEEFAKLVTAADYYVSGQLQKSSSLSVVVNEWKQRAKSVETYIGYNIGFPRLDDWTSGLRPGSLGYILASPHQGKTSLLRSIAYNLYANNPELIIDYFSNDDSLKVTLSHFVAMVGELSQTDVQQPLIAYADDKSAMRIWEQAVDKLSSMADRLTIVDRSYSRPLEEISECLIKWRIDNPNGQRAVLIDGFSKVSCIETQGMEDGRRSAILRSDQLKLLAQQSDVPVMVTMDVPKLYGRRPHSGDMANSVSLEFDCDLAIGCYIEANAKGHINATDLKMEVTFKDGNTELLPIIEVAVLKNKQTGINDIDLMLLDKSTSSLEELDDVAWTRNKQLVFQSIKAAKESYKK